MGAVVFDIAKAVIADPVGAFTDAIREVTENVIGPHVPQTFTDFLPGGLTDTISPFGTLVGLSQKGSAVGASMPQIDKFMVDDVIFDVVESEQIEFENDIPRHPTEDRQMVVDHIWRLPKRINVKGSLIGYPLPTEKHKQALIKLDRIREEGLPVTVIADFPPGRMGDMALTRFSVTREYPWRNEYLIDISLEQAEYVRPLGIGRGSDLSHISGADPVIELPGSGFRPEGAPRDLGVQEGKTGDIPPKNIFQNIFDGIANMVKSIESVPLGEKLLDIGRNFVRQNIPGAGLVMDALNGNLSAWSAIEGVASLVPGAGALVGIARDWVEPAIQTINQLGGIGAIAGIVTGNPNAQTESAARNLARGLIDAAAATNPAIGAIARIVKGALGA